MVTETDHMFMAPPPNDATERRPVGFKFYYMTAMDAKLKPVVTKFLAPGIDPSTVDQASRATLRPVASTKHCPRFSSGGPLAYYYPQATPRRDCPALVRHYLYTRVRAHPMFMK